MPCHALPKKICAKQNQQVHQSKQQICHISIFIQWKEHGNQNTEYAISIKRVRQPKHQVRHLNQKNTPTKTPNTPSQSKQSNVDSLEIENVNFRGALI